MNTNHDENLPPYINQTDKVILFDGVCKLCNAWSNFIIQNDKARKFKLASVQSPEGKAILSHFGYPTDYYETMLVVHGNKCYEKSDAFLFVMNELAYPWKFMIIFKVIHKTIRNWLYDRIALNRYQLFGKYEYCNLPTADHKERYLDGSR